MKGTPRALRSRYVKCASGGAIPLIVIDVYEHAFYIDYQNRKPEYIEKFMKHIDWTQAGARYRSVVT